MRDTPDRLMSELPWIYHASGELQTLLACFEALLLGPEEDALERKIARIPSLFRPEPPPSASGSELGTTPSEFLPWLAQWVALSQFQGLTEGSLRALIARLIPLYGIRGTKAYLEAMLRHYLPQGVRIEIDDQERQGLTVGRSRVGVESLLGGDRPHWFSVRIVWEVPPGDADEPADIQKRYGDTVRSVIELAKPAHTAYRLEWEFFTSSAAANG